MSTSFDPSNPEDGFYWRGLTADEVVILDDHAQTYGRPAGIAPNGLPELFGMPTMKQKHCARFFSSKTNAVGWAKRMGAGAKVLAVPMAKLLHGVDYDIWPKTNDVYITGEAARMHGVVYDPDNVP